MGSRAMLGRTWHGWLGLALLLVAVAGSLAGAGIIRRWFYVLAWLGYIMALDGLIQARTGDSLMRERAGTFWLMALVSASFWFGWEAVNLRIHNWQYVDAEPILALRWAMGFIAFATVLPAIFSTYEALECLGFKYGPECAPLAQDTLARRGFLAWYNTFGAAINLAPAFFPPGLGGALLHFGAHQPQDGR